MLSFNNRHKHTYTSIFDNFVQIILLTYKLLLVFLRYDKFIKNIFERTYEYEIYFYDLILKSSV